MVTLAQYSAVEFDARMNDIHKRIEAVQDRIRIAETRFQRPPGSVRLLAVSKTQTASAVARAGDCGLRAFGENKLQEALTKMQALADSKFEWHFIGPLQSNKTRSVAENFAWLHSLDREKTARRLSAQRPAALPPLNVLIQVNSSDETSKSGVNSEHLEELAGLVCALPGLHLRGLMAIPKPATEVAVQRAQFAQIRCLFEDLLARGYSLDQLSMGMSVDLEAAIAEGSTWVRIGTALFGPRSVLA